MFHALGGCSLCRDVKPDADGKVGVLEREGFVGVCSPCQSMFGDRVVYVRNVGATEPTKAPAGG